MTRTVSIAMCTYNGAKYIGAQLESILSQTRRPDEIIVCDDCSGDETPELIDRFARRAPFPVRTFRNETNLGPGRNFEQALSLCEGDVVFFCDQDDFWLPQKIERMLKRLIASEDEFGRDTPILVHCDLEVVDAALRTIDGSFIRYGGFSPPEPDLMTILHRNVVTGCASAVNASLARLMLPFPEFRTLDRGLLHDWWSGLCAAGGGRIVFLDEALVRYRFHDSNVSAQPRKGLLQRLLNAKAAEISTVPDRVSRRNRSGAVKIERQIEMAKRLIGALSDSGRFDAGRPEHRIVRDLARLESMPALGRLPTIWRTRWRNRGLRKNLARAIRIMEL